MLPVLKQSANAGPCAADPRRWPGPPACASATETRGPGPDDGCWAGRSACPWPRHTLLVSILRRGCGEHTGSPLCLPHATHSVSSVNFCVLLVTGAVSGQEPVAAVSPTFGRLFEGTDAGSPGQTPSSCPAESDPTFTVVTPASAVHRPADFTGFISPKRVVARAETC